MQAVVGPGRVTLADRSRVASPACAKSSARSGPTSWPASPSVRPFTAGCRRTSWRIHGQGRPGGRCRWRWRSACRCTKQRRRHPPHRSGAAGQGRALAPCWPHVSVIALSLPEMVILRKVLKMRLIATFVGSCHGHPDCGLCVQRGAVSAARHRQLRVTRRIPWTSRSSQRLWKNCRNTIALIEQVAKAKGVPVTLNKVEAMRDIAGYGVMRTPGVVIRRQGRACGRRAWPRQGRAMVRGSEQEQDSVNRPGREARITRTPFTPAAVG